MKKIKKVVLGLDLSLTHSGYCLIEEGGIIIDSGVIKSKPSGDKPEDELIRLLNIVDEVFVSIHGHIERIEVAVIENLAFLAKGTSLTILAGLSYLIRDMLHKERISFIMVAPTTLKKYITGSGRGEKDLMMMSIYKDYGFEAMDNNEADAAGLAYVGLALLGVPVKKLNQSQQEVIKLLKKQI